METDRLSNLPDPIIHHILFLTDTKYAVQTSVLSKMWRHMWKCVDRLNLDWSSFGIFHVLKNFVLQFSLHCGLSSSRFRTIKFYLRNHYEDQMLVCISAQRLKFLNINNMSPLNLRIHECPTLEKMNVRASTAVTWREENVFWKGYIFDVTGNQNKGKFVSHHINSDSASDLNEIVLVNVLFSPSNIRTSHQLGTACVVVCKLENTVEIAVGRWLTRNEVAHGGGCGGRVKFDFDNNMKCYCYSENNIIEFVVRNRNINQASNWLSLN
ncbi:hypothetical protein QYF36_026814 [Acer negundo]|nr:hypothetical protein QYF36_026814 [Acer negundo]